MYHVADLRGAQRINENHMLSAFPDTGFSLFYFWMLTLPWLLRQLISDKDLPSRRSLQHLHTPGCSKLIMLVLWETHPHDTRMFINLKCMKTPHKIYLSPHCFCLFKTETRGLCFLGISMQVISKTLFWKLLDCGLSQVTEFVLENNVMAAPFCRPTAKHYELAHHQCPTEQFGNAALKGSDCKVFSCWVHCTCTE